MSIQLNRLKRTSKAIDSITESMAETYNRLGNKMNAMLASSKVGNSTVDVALARANIEKMLVDSGYYEVVDNLLNNTYQEMIDAAHDSYKASLGKSLQYTDVSLERINQIKNIDMQTSNSLAESNVNDLQNVLLDYQFGATDLKSAVERLQTVMEDDMKRYAETVIRSTAHAFDRQASNLMARDGGLELFEYVGPDDAVTSEICQDLLAKGVMKWDEWAKITNDGGYPVTVYGGHPNCRHSLVPVLGE